MSQGAVLGLEVEALTESAELEICVSFFDETSMTSR